MRILYLGDIVGRSARQTVCEKLPEYRRRFGLDFVMVNGENAAGGFGITAEITRDLINAGADVITGGNHSWDQRSILEEIDNFPQMIRPANYPEGTAGKGCGLFVTAEGQRVLVLQVMGRVFMDPLEDPFRVADDILEPVQLGRDVDVILADIHGEATSEKMAFAHYLDGRVSCVVGTHTHVPTADTQILPNGTAYQSDLGMCGDYDSVIGMDKDEPIQRFMSKIPSGRFTPAMGEATLCGIVVDTDPASGLALSAQAFRDGPRLAPQLPAEKA